MVLLRKENICRTNKSTMSPVVKTRNGASVPCTGVTRYLGMCSKKRPLRPKRAMLRADIGSSNAREDLSVDAKSKECTTAVLIETATKTDAANSALRGLSQYVCITSTGVVIKNE